MNESDRSPLPSADLVPLAELMASAAVVLLAAAVVLLLLLADLDPLAVPVPRAARAARSRN